MKVTRMPVVDFGERAPTSAAPAAEHYTEAWAAERFASEQGEALRYDHRRARWLEWSGHAWSPDNSGAVTRYALAAVRQWQRQAVEIPDTFARKRAVDFLISLERGARLQAVLALARCLRPLAVDGEDWDKDPWLLGTPAGVVELKTGTLRAGRPEDGITMQTSAGFDPQARCPRWEQAIREWFPDADLAEYVWQALGYSITGVTTQQEVYMGYNGGAGGKSTLLRAVAHALGDYAYDMPFSVLETHVGDRVEPRVSEQPSTCRG